VRLILDNFGIVDFLFFGRMPVDSSHFSLHFDSILSPKDPKYFLFNVLIKAQFNPCVWSMDQLAADRRMYLKCTKYNFTCSRRDADGTPEVLFVEHRILVLC
jgi:hypothetical protein